MKKVEIKPLSRYCLIDQTSELKNIRVDRSAVLAFFADIDIERKNSGICEIAQFC